MHKRHHQRQGALVADVPTEGGEVPGDYPPNMWSCAKIGVNQHFQAADSGDRKDTEV
jgi:hypothetical protein